jgi:hypothetical protein
LWQYRDAGIQGRQPGAPAPRPEWVAFALDNQSREHDVADDVPVAFGDKRQHEISIAPQRLDEVRFALAGKDFLQQLADWAEIGGGLEPDQGHAGPRSGGIQRNGMRTGA